MNTSIFRTADVTPDQVQHLIATRGIESERIDFKQELDDGRKILQTIAAMANGVGGLIVIGVTDGGPQRSRQPVGVDPKTAERLVNLCDTLLDPPFAPEIFEVHVAGERILAVRVEPTRPVVRPVLVRKGQDAEVYVRRGDSTRQASPLELRALFSGSGGSPILDPYLGPILRPQVPNAWHNNRDIALGVQVTCEDVRGRGQGQLSTQLKRQINERLNSIPLTRAQLFSGSTVPLHWTVTLSGARFVRFWAEVDHLPPSESGRLQVQIDAAGIITVEIELKGVTDIGWTHLIDLVSRAVASVTDPGIMSATANSWWRPLIGIHMRAPARGLRDLVSFPPTWTSHEGWNDSGADLETLWEDASSAPIVTRFFETTIANLGFLDFEADLHKQCAAHADVD